MYRKYYLNKANILNTAQYKFSLVGQIIRKTEGSFVRDVSDNNQEVNYKLTA